MIHLVWSLDSTNPQWASLNHIYLIDDSTAPLANGGHGEILIPGQNRVVDTAIVGLAFIVVIIVTVRLLYNKLH